MARRHLAEAEARIARQRALIYDLQAAGHPTDLARQILRSWLDTLRQMKVHEEYLEGCNRDG